MYTFYNPRTKRLGLSYNWSESLMGELLEDKENDFLIVFSPMSNTIKVVKWQPEDSAERIEAGPKNMGEVYIPHLMRASMLSVEAEHFFPSVIKDF